MTYRYLAGYRKGDRMVGEKNFRYGYAEGRVRHHWTPNHAGRMYWCACFKGYRLAGEARWPVGPTRTKTFSHHRGSSFHRVYWHRARRGTL